MSRNKTVLAGHVGVDSGQVMVGDPCYLKEWKDEGFNSSAPFVGPFSFDYDGACRATCSDAMVGQLGGYHTAVAVSSGYGDGTYPVYVEKNPEGRVVAMHVYFDEDPNEAPECPECGGEDCEDECRYPGDSAEDECDLCDGDCECCD